MCCTTKIPLSYDRQSMLCEHRTKFGIRETIVRLYYECLTTVVGLLYDSRATVVRFFFIKMVYVCTHNNVFIARQSHDSGKTLSRQPQDSDTIKKIVEQKRCMSNFRHTTHDSATMLKISCDCRTMITNDPRFDQFSCRAAAQMCRWFVVTRA